MREDSKALKSALEGIYPPGESCGVMLVKGIWLCRNAGEKVSTRLTFAQARKLTGLAAPEREKREPVPLYGDYAWLAAINGIRTDGTGQQARWAA